MKRRYTQGLRGELDRVAGPFAVAKGNTGRNSSSVPSPEPHRDRVMNAASR